MDITQMVKQVREQAAKYFAERGEAITEPRSAVEYLEAALSLSDRESFGALFLDNKHKVLGFDVIFEGTIDQAPVFPREVARLALIRNATAVIVAHNHPSGDTAPSREDEKITKELTDALSLVGLRLLDHIIVGRPGEYSSMKELGLF